MIEPINAAFDDVARKMVTPATHLPKGTNALNAKNTLSPATPPQGGQEQAKRIGSLYQPQAIEDKR